MHRNGKSRLPPGSQINQDRRPLCNSHASSQTRGSQQPLTPLVLTHLPALWEGGPVAVGRTHALTWFFSWTEQKALRRSLMMDK